MNINQPKINDKEGLAEFVNRESIRLIYDPKIGPERMKNADKLLIDYSIHIKEKYPNWLKCKFFHILISSTYEEKDIEFLDFPSPDSVVEFLKSLENQ